MDNGQVADVLEEIATLLEIQGENPFKSRAYLNAARTLRGLEDKVEDLVREGRLAGLKGIGEALTEKITTLVRTGALPYHQELLAAVPGPVLALLKIPGLGPRKARTLVERLGVTSLGELEYACHENRLAGLEGFGPRSQEKILQGIERLKRYASRFLIGDAWPAAERLAATLAALPGVGRVEPAGGVRRREETVEEIVLVAASPDPRATLAACAASASLARVGEAGATRLSATLAEGIPLTLLAAPEEAFACALLHATGNAAHLAGLRERARGRGLALEESALRRGTERLPAASEEAIYQALGMLYVPPELREGLGEIEAAAAGTLPDLVEPGDVRGILHVHSTWSDGRLPIETIVRRCADLGYEYVGITDHSQSARYARGLTPESLRQQQMDIDEARQRHPGIRVLKGSEVDILPDGRLDYPDEILATLDFVVASVHSSFGLPEEEQTRRIIRALENPRTTILGHPTGRLLLAREPYAVRLEEVLRAAARLGVHVELNANPHRLDLDTAAARLARSLGVRLAIDPDAHDEAGLTDVRFGLGVARRAGLTADRILNTVPAADLPRALLRT